MSEQNPEIVPMTGVVIPPRPRPTDQMERDADRSIRYLTRFIDSSRLDPDLRISLSDIKNTIKTLRDAVARMSEEAQDNHDKLVEVVRSQRLM